MSVPPRPCWCRQWRLRRRNPAPFAAFLDFDEVQIASASPERFLELRGRRVETRPIKGTRPRGATPEADRRLGAELLASAKDRAENVMIVDLLRNDLSRVCRDHTVLTPELCVLESFATVHHLVSTVTGELRDGLDAVDLLRATFPGGSITGAPKIRAMEIIAELEPSARGPYCGSIGWLGFDGWMDTSITIRTFALRGRRVAFQAGGGIVADSEPAAEYAETLDKARALRNQFSIGACAPDDATLDAVLRAAREVFLARGISATTAEVAERAGISEGTIFHRFKSKAELFRAAMDISADDFAAEWVQGLEARVGRGDIAAELDDLAHRALAFFRRMMPLMMMSWSNSDSSGLPDKLRVPNSPPLLALKRLTAYFEAEMRRGRLRRHDPEIVARTFLGSITNYALFEIFMTASEELPLPPETFVRGLVQVLWSGIAPLPAGKQADERRSK